jgi:Mg2+ and Co2+ transporter CorA
MLESAQDKTLRHLDSELSFAAIHNCAKHIIFLGEVLESCIMLVDAAMANVPNTPHGTGTASRQMLIRQQLVEALRYRRTLFRSTQLRLSSLQKRIDNVIALAFNLVTQQGSVAMMQDSRAMKTIAAITMIFLPTTGVATVLGSQLFASQWMADGQRWEVKTTPLFWITWWVSVPLTVVVIVLAAVWQWCLDRNRTLASRRRGAQAQGQQS